ncbi:hypothetical protein F8M41_016963 [Gigaspora margarita]|uniref:TPR-like protein n=1 Tax=Gigaspora margarita TaxID=4874 RepID=A0A8H4ANM9_GIGMA|nr:hypothetical protein F8M41_016963 [Gigaspora margarita]
MDLNHSKDNEDAIIHTTNPIPLQCQLFYFEIDIIKNDKNKKDDNDNDNIEGNDNNKINGIIAIRFCTKSAELNKLSGIAFQVLKDLKSNLYPCIGIRSKESKGKMSIEANFGNFGHKKFKYTDIIEDFINQLNLFESNQQNRVKYHTKTNFIMGKYKEALTNLNDLLEIEQSNAFALRYYGETYLILYEYEKSNIDLIKLLKINKDDKWASKASEKINRW